MGEKIGRRGKDARSGRRGANQADLTHHLLHAAAARHSGQEWLCDDGRESNSGGDRRRPDGFDGDGHDDDARLKPLAS